MSDLMHGIPFKRLLTDTINEYKNNKTCYYVPVFEIKQNDYTVAGKPVSLPIGPAAGPHTQLAQNIIAGFIAGARIFELKTVQVMEGEELGIIKPCIYVSDEAYNTEWSTELTVTQAAEEYIKAYIMLHILAKEFNLKPDFQFHISVGYDLAGIKTPKIDNFLNTMQDASNSDIWKESIKTVLDNINIFENVNIEFVNNLSPKISELVTLSTMHGCPPEEIEKIATYLINEKGYNTYIKCNPTLIGYEKVRKLLDDNGYTDISFDTSHFEHDMKLDDALSMINRLMSVAQAKNLIFGVKLTNTFPVDIKNNELTGETMYMSGKPLFLLAIHVAKVLSEATNGTLPISFSGGIDTHNINDVLSCGISPVTVATLLLKAGGYKNLSKLAELAPEKIPDKVDINKLSELCDKLASDTYYQRKQTKQNIKSSTPPDACFKCKNCVDVCPNRANFPLKDIKACVHIDSYCNECGNCACLCPFGYVPYRDKFTYFENLSDFENSNNDGFLNKDKYRYKGKVFEDLNQLPDELQQVVLRFMQGGEKDE